MFLVRRRAIYWLFLLCLCFATTCRAIGFGELKVYSYLDEQLVAEIELTNFEGMDTNLLKVNLADAKDFTRAGIERPYILTYLLFQTFTYNNRLFILVRTSRPVKIPYLEFLVEVSWPEGNLIKDYTILLDPPPVNMSISARPKAMSALSEEESKKTVNVESAIQEQINMQKAAQQKKEAEESLKSVVRMSPNSFADQTFDLPVEKPKEKTQLVPSEVPEVLAEEEAQKEKAKEVADKKYAAQERVEYQKQLRTYTQEQQREQVAKSKKEANESPLSSVVNDLDFIDNNLETMNVDQIVAAQNAYEDARKPATENNANGAAVTTVATKPPEEAVDFSHPLPPATPLSKAPTTPTEAPAAPAFKIPANVPMVGTAPSGGNHLYLGLILSLLLIAAGVAIAVKRGMLSNIKLKRSAAAVDAAAAATAEAPVTEVPVTEAGEAKTFEEAADEFNAEENEEIELTAAPAAPVAATTATPVAPTQAVAESLTATASTEDLNKFEKDFEKMDLNQLAPEPPPKMGGAMDAFKFTQATPAAEKPTANTPTEEAPITLTPAPEPASEAPFVASEPVVAPEAPAPFPKSTLKLADENAEITPPTMEKPTAKPTQLPASESPTLAPAAGSIIDNSEAVHIKLDLAKKYLETGDRESARSLLHEILEIANDSQKIEAQLLLSGIQ